MNCSRELTTSFELGLGLGIDISVIGLILLLITQPVRNSNWAKIPG